MNTVSGETLMWFQGQASLSTIYVDHLEKERNGERKPHEAAFRTRNPLHSRRFSLILAALSLYAVSHVIGSLAGEVGLGMQKGARNLCKSFDLDLPKAIFSLALPSGSGLWAFFWPFKTAKNNSKKVAQTDQKVAQTHQKVAHKTSKPLKTIKRH